MPRLFPKCRVSATLARMFTTVSPVCPTTDLARTIRFWQQLGFVPLFADQVDVETASYAGMGRVELELHLQTFTPGEIKTTQTMAMRIKLNSREALEALYAEWSSHGRISAPLETKPWGSCEFGFYDPDKTPCFFYVDL